METKSDIHVLHVLNTTTISYSLFLPFMFFKDMGIVFVRGCKVALKWTPEGEMKRGCVKSTQERTWS